MVQIDRWTGQKTDIQTYIPRYRQMDNRYTYGEMNAHTTFTDRYINVLI